MIMDKAYSVKRLSRREYIAKICDVGNKVIISDEALKAFEVLFSKLVFQRARPVTFALLVHEIGHLDASFCNEAVVHSITVAGRTLAFNNDYTSNNNMWTYNFNILNLRNSYTFAYSEDVELDKLHRTITEMYRTGLDFTKHITELDLNGLWVLKNPLEELSLRSHFNKNSFNSRQSLYGDVDVLNKLGSCPQSVFDINAMLKSLCKK